MINAPLSLPTDGRPCIGFDLGGTKMYAVVLGPGGQELGSQRRATEGYRGAAKGIEHMIETIEQALVDASVRAEDLACIGVGCPGVVELDSGVLHSAPNLGWSQVPIRAALQERFGVPVAVINDVDSGTYGEFIAGAGRGARSLLGVFPGTGVGGGCIYDGRLLRGKRYSAMEIGNLRWPAAALVSDPDIPPNLEGFCSRLAIAGACVQEAYRGHAPTLMAKAGTDIRKVKSKALAKAYREGDEGIKAVLGRAAEYLAMGIAAAVDLIGPDRVVIGGGLAVAMPEVFIDGIGDKVRQFASPALVEDLKIVPAELGDLATVVGAAGYTAAEYLPR